jgi:hypothetical protein
MAKKVKTFKAPKTNEERLALELSRGPTIRSERRVIEGLGKPTRSYFVGDKVARGNLVNCFIAVVVDEYFVVIGHTPSPTRDYTPLEGEIHYQYAAWFEVVPATVLPVQVEFLGAKHRLNFSSSGVESLIHKVVFFGMDFSPEFQRDYVWTQEDKEKFLDSVFKWQDIGKWTIWKRPYPKSDIVVDGKQRLSTLVDFFLDKTTWRGVKYSELDGRSRRVFREAPVQCAEISENTPYKDVLEIFLDMNTGGVPQLPEHIERVRKLWEEQ